MASRSTKLLICLSTLHLWVLFKHKVYFLMKSVLQIRTEKIQSYVQNSHASEHFQSNQRPFPHHLSDLNAMSLYKNQILMLNYFMHSCSFWPFFWHWLTCLTKTNLTLAAISPYNRKFCQYTFCSKLLAIVYRTTIQ